MKLDDIRQLCDEATPGPWESNGLFEIESSHAIIADTIPGVSDLPFRQAERNAMFIAAARTLMPILLEIAEASKAFIESGVLARTHVDSAGDDIEETLKKLEEL